MNYLDMVLEWCDIHDGAEDIPLADTQAFIALMEAHQECYGYEFSYEIVNDREGELDYDTAIGGLVDAEPEYAIICTILTDEEEFTVSWNYDYKEEM